MKFTKLTAKFFLIITLLASIALGDDGQMNGGGFADDGQMNGGGYTCTETEYAETPEKCTDPNTDGFTETALDFVKDYLTTLIG